jgi:hypothetical protein
MKIENNEKINKPKQNNRRGSVVAPCYSVVNLPSAGQEHGYVK